jgi:hypothetical protein
MLRDDRDGVVAEERRPPRDHLVEHRAERVEIGARFGGSAECLLGRHVRDGADHHAFDGEARAIAGDREAEVAELRRAVGGQPDVARLHVAVDDAGVVRVLEGPADFAGDTHRLLERQAMLRRALQQGRRLSRRPCTGSR